MPAPQIIYDLVEQFERNIETYKRAQNETQVRREFIDPFFKALGWDIDNSNGAAPQYQDVVHEDQLKIAGSMKAPDYAFRIGGQRKFYVEAKKPSVHVKDDPGPALQVRTYAWNAKLDSSIVTDFEEFAVYECSSRPKAGDKPSVGRINYYTYKDYIDKWDEISGIFSKESVIKGLFDKYATGSKGKRGTQTVDKAFLAEIEKWRELLAKNFAKNNNITEEELKFATQRTLDRIIFLRICEARRIEEEGRLQSAVSGTNAYKNLFLLFQAADNRYNSGLFYFRKGDKAHTSESELDTITPKLKLDDKVLKEIIGGLYYPSPYLFDVIPADILGQVYEQFLGKVIRMTSGGMVKIEEKPEVRKAGGVYYTPTYIVDYIVKNTVGKKLEEEAERFHVKEEVKRKAKDLSQKLTILDPACGSGSFLLGAYNYLLHWYLGEYSKKAATILKQKNAPIYERSSGVYSLTTFERKRILLEHIYGVDIDEQAVEVAKLNLMLKCLEGEAGPNLKLSVERILPDLSDNIKCGNSLIDPDFSDGLFSGEDKKINAFNWNAEFPYIMRKGGFDVVIGNPPYGAAFEESVKRYFKSSYKSIVGKYESYGFFYEKALSLIKNEGVLGYITPHSWLTVTEATSLRELILQQTKILKIIKLPTKVFKDATVNTVITILKRSGNKSERDNNIVNAILIEPTAIISGIAEIEHVNNKFKQNAWLTSDTKAFNIDISKEAQNVLEHIQKNSTPFDSLCEFSVGIQAYDSHTGQTKETIEGRVYHAIKQVNKTYKKELNGNDVGRYTFAWQPGNWISYGEWLAHPRQKRFFEGPRILVREITSSGEHIINASYAEEDYINYKTILNILLRPQIAEKEYSIFFFLGILNSLFISWFFKKNSNKLITQTFPRVSILDMKRFPVKEINFSNKTEKQNHDKLVSLVARMLSLNKELPQAKTPQSRTQLERQIAHTDSDIDRLVYELYGLSEEEIKIVEG